MISWNNWYIKIKQYSIDEIYIKCDEIYYYCDFDKLQCTPLWDKINNIAYWLNTYKWDFEFSKEIDSHIYNEYIHHIKNKKWNKN